MIGGPSRGGDGCGAQVLQGGRITSVSAMVFMADSERAAKLAKESELDAGLHLNFSETLPEKNNSGRLSECHNRLVRYLRRNKYSQLFYNPSAERVFLFVRSPGRGVRAFVWKTAVTHRRTSSHASVR
jgi:hypothetical protein